MAINVTVTDLVAVLGLGSGVAGTVLGILNYMRDRAKVEVSLQWDMEVTPGSGLDHTKRWCVITATNVGRRPVHVSHAALRLPKGYDGSHLLSPQSVSGQTLTEGSPSGVYVMTQEGLERYAKDWRKITAQVNDSSGRAWRSKRVTRKEVPSWARTAV
jgi:hypothetical protein